MAKQVYVTFEPILIELEDESINSSYFQEIAVTAALKKIFPDIIITSSQFDYSKVASIIKA